MKRARLGIEDLRRLTEEAEWPAGIFRHCPAWSRADHIRLARAEGAWLAASADARERSQWRALALLLATQEFIERKNEERQRVFRSVGQKIGYSSRSLLRARCSVNRAGVVHSFGHWHLFLLEHKTDTPKVPAALYLALQGVWQKDPGQTARQVLNQAKKETGLSCHVRTVQRLIGSWASGKIT
jgi:hypothetical protein